MTKKLVYGKKTPDYIKRTCVLLLIIISFFALIIQPSYTYCASASLLEMSEDLGQHVNDLLNDIDFTPIEEVVNKFDDNQAKMFSIGNIKEKVTSIINGEQAVNYTTIMEVVLQVLMQLINIVNLYSRITPKLSL